MANKRLGRTLRWVSAILLSMLVMGWACAGLAAFTPFYARCNTNNLRIRMGANTTSSIQDHIMNDTLVWVIEEQTNAGIHYYQVEYINSLGARSVGWVAYKDSTNTYFHNLTVDEMNQLPYMNGVLPDTSTSGSGSSGSGSSGSGSSGSGSSGSGSSSSSQYGYLKLGSKGEAVRKLQQRLKDLKMYSGDVTGSFGQKTEDAVKAFQKKMGLHVDGIAGPGTQEKLYNTGSSSSGGSSSGGSGSLPADPSDLGITLFAKVNLRSTASIGDNSKSLLPKDKVFTIISKSRVGNDIWYYVQVDSVKGYVRSDMMRVLTAAEATAYRQGINPATPTPTSNPLATPTPTPVGTPIPMPTGTSTASTGGLARITGSNVNMRDGAGTKFSLVGKLQKGDVLELDTSAAVSGVTWYRLIKGSLAGWVHGDYVHVMTAAEINDYNNNNTTTPPVVVTPPTTYRLLKEGSKGTDVTKLQQTLKNMGIYSGNVTGTFGTKTTAAVKAYQKKAGLYVDGIAGPNTQAKLYGTGTGTGGGTIVDVPMPPINGVENIPWDTFKATVSYAVGGKAVLTDVRSGKSFNIVKQSAGLHLDVEPATANDTAILTQIYGGKITYLRRPVWLTVGGRTFAGSIYAVAHGTSTVKNNNFDGQFCVHLLNSKTHVGNQVDPDHAKCVQEAYDKAANRIP